MSAPDLVPPGTTGGGTPVGGSGTPNTITKWNTTTTLNDSVITQSGLFTGFNKTIPLYPIDVVSAGGAVIKLTRDTLNSFDAVITSVMTGTGSGDLAWGTTQADGGFAWRVNNSATFAMGITETGNVGIGTASPGYPLHVIGQVAGSSFVSTSDERDKNISGPVPHGLAFVEQLNPIAFTFKTSREDATPAGGIHYGFSAQSVLALEGDNPAIIDTKDQDNLKIHDAGLVPILVNALQELNAKFEAYVAAQEAKCL